MSSETIVFYANVLLPITLLNACGMGQPNDDHNYGFSDDRCWVPQMSYGTILGKVDD